MHGAALALTARTRSAEPFPPAGAADQHAVVTADRHALGTADHHAVVTVQQRLRSLQAEKDALERFAAIAAHELMEPLVMAEACAALLADHLGPHVVGEARSDLDNLLRGASRMRLLVETLLHDARASRQPLERAPVDLREVVDESVELLRREIRAHEIDLRIGALPVVAGNATLLGVVVNNLLLNAIRYGPRTGGRIDVRARRVRGGWRVVVSSDGATVPPEERERIFDPFRRVEHERRIEGTGIGLTICRSIVERHAGTIGVQAKSPRGNRFYFTLPDEAPAEEPASAVVTPRAPGAAASARPLRGVS